jgi:hypothetical protein
MSGMGMFASVLVTIGFILFAKDGHFGMAFGLLALVFGWGIWRVVQFVRESREREARLWDRIDLGGPRS